MDSRIQMLKNGAREALVMLRSRQTLFLVSGLVIGYVLGLFRSHEILMQHALSLRVDFSVLAPFSRRVSTFFDRSISRDFLSDVALFDTAIIAFLIPLSLDMILKISERYQSEVVLRPFENEWENRILLWCLLLNVFVALAMRFLIDDAHLQGWWKVLAWILFVVFGFIAYTIYSFMGKLKEYMSDTEFLMRKLFDDASRAIHD